MSQLPHHPLRDFDWRNPVPLARTMRLYEQWTRVLTDHQLSQQLLQRLVATGQLDPPLDVIRQVEQLIQQDVRLQWIVARGDPLEIAEVMTALYPQHFLSIWFTYRIVTSLGARLGQFTVRFRHGADFRFLAPQVKRDLFANRIIFEIVVRRESRRWLRRFSNNPQRALQDLQRSVSQAHDVYDRELFAAVLQEYEDTLTMPLPATLVQSVYGQPFPAIHQLLAIRLFLRKGGLLNFDDTGLYKTSTMIACAVVAGAQKILIVSPKAVKHHWEEEIHRFCATAQSVVRVEAESKKEDLEAAASPDVRWVIINNDLVLLDVHDEPSFALPRLLQLPFQAVFDDEAHGLVNPATQRTRALIQLMRLPSVRWRALLTATPYRTGAANGWLYAAALMPQQYLTEEIFRRSTQGSPRVVRNVLLPYSVRRSADEVLHLPPLSEDLMRPRCCTLTPAQRVIYDTVLADETLLVLPKITLLRQAATVPELVRRYLRRLLPRLLQRQRRLKRVYQAWQQYQQGGGRLPFGADTLCELGYQDLFLDLFCHTRGGIDAYMQRWKSRRVWARTWNALPISGMVRALLEVVREALALRRKVLILNLYKVGFTQLLLIEQTHGVCYSAFSWLRRAFGQHAVVAIDGNVPLHGPDSPRQRIANQFRFNPAVRVLTTTWNVSSLGVDYTVQDRSETGVLIVCFGLPYTPDRYRQGYGRVWRPGAQTPVEEVIIEPGGTIEEGVRCEILLPRRRLIAMAQDGAPLTDEEQQLINGDPQALERVLRHYLVTPWQRVMWISAHLQEKVGEVSLRRVLRQPYDSRRSTGQVFACYFAQGMWRRGAGHSVRFAASIVRMFAEGGVVRPPQILEVGLGVGVLSSVLRQPVISLDLNPHAWMRRPRFRRRHSLVVVGSTLRLPFDGGRLEAVILSHILQRLALEERGQALSEALRMLVKPGGVLLLQIPGRYMRRRHHQHWCRILRRAGVRIVRQFTGSVRVADHVQAGSTTASTTSEDVEAQQALQQPPRRRSRRFRIWSIVGWVTDQYDQNLLSASSFRLTIDDVNDVVVEGSGVRGSTQARRTEEPLQPEYRQFRVYSSRTGRRVGIVNTTSRLSSAVLQAIRQARGLP